MYHKKQISILRIVAVLLGLTLAMPMSAKAATVEPVQPLASAYLNAYGAYVYAAGDGKVQVWYDVNGTRYLGMLGVKTIKLYHSIDSQTWYLAQTYSYETTPSLMSYNDYFHSGHVDFDGVPGRFYKATVTFYGGSSATTGDSRDYYTSTILSD